MRIIVWLAIGFASACALAAYILPVSWLFWIAGVLAGAAAVCFLLRKRWGKFVFCALVLLGASAGFGWYGLFDSLTLAPARSCHETILSAQITATDYSRPTDYGGSVDGQIRLQGHTYKVRLYLDEAGTVEPGDLLSGAFRLRYTAPKEGRRTSYYQGEGVFLLAYQRGNLDILTPDRKPLTALPALLRRSIQIILKDTFPEDAFPFALALLLGDDSELAYRQNSDFSITGIRHIVAVSGLHISLLYTLVSSITFRRRFLTLLLGLPVLMLFAGVAGFTPSVTRACLMTALMMAAQLVQKEYDPPTGLGFACLVMLLVNPLTITSVGFQLSSLSVAGILLFEKPLEGWLLAKIPLEPLAKAKPVRGAAASVAMTLSSQVFTVPLSAAYFGTVSILGVLTNLLTLWVTNLTFLGILVTCGLGLIIPLLGKILGWLLAWPIRYVLLVSSVLAKAPLAAVYTASPYISTWLWMCCCLAVAWGGGRLLGRRERPGKALLLAALGLCIALGCSWLEPGIDECRVTVLDVGQGQCILFQSEGKSFLIDCGGDTEEKAADEAFHLLYSQGIRRLDGVILTHGDDDHAGGLDELATRLEISMVLLPATDTQVQVPETVPQVIRVDRKTEITFGTAQITLFPPVFSQNDNENSLCILLQTPNCNALITGDRSQEGEKELLRQYSIPKLDLLIAGHHGSNHSTGNVLLKLTQPETVIVSVSRYNTYGHPGWELLQRLAGLGCDFYRTDLHGTIVFRK